MYSSICAIESFDCGIEAGSCNGSFSCRGESVVKGIDGVVKLLLLGSVVSDVFVDVLSPDESGAWLPLRLISNASVVNGIGGLKFKSVISSK